MHENNRKWLADVAQHYSRVISGASVLELGSRDINGTPRPLFSSTSRYIGVDIVAGGGVDVVQQAKDTAFLLPFDMIVCLSMLEHDQDWGESLLHNLQWLRGGGLLVLAWGAEGNTRHDPEPWALVPVEAVRCAVEGAGMVILDSFFEEERYGPDCPGCYNILAEKPAA